MKKSSLSILICFIVLVGALVASSTSALAQNTRTACFPSSPTRINRTDNSATFTIGPTTPGEQYKIKVSVKATATCLSRSVDSPWIEARSNSITYTFNRSRCDDRIFHPNLFVGLVSLEKRRADAPMCTSSYTLASACQLSISPTSLNTDTPLVIKGVNVPRGFTHNRLVITGARSKSLDVNISSDNSFTQQVGALESAGSYTIKLLQYQPQQGGKKNDACPTMNIQVGFPGQAYENKESVTADERSQQYVIPTKNFNPYCGAWTQIDTAIGCIPVGSTDSFVGWFLSWAIGIAGGIAFLFILIAGFMIMTAAGKPERVQAGRELLTASISGLLIIIFSVFLLKLIGVEILHIPDFG